jgi:hypothetical protein
VPSLPVPVRVGTRAIVLAGHLLNSIVRNIEIRRGSFGLVIPAKIPAKRMPAAGFCFHFQCAATIVARNPESNQLLKLLLLLYFFPWCPWPITAQYHNYMNLKQLL